MGCPCLESQEQGNLVRDWEGSGWDGKGLGRKDEKVGQEVGREQGG